MAADATDEGFDLLPTATEPPDPDEALSLEASLADPNAIVTVQGAPAPLGRAPAIDFAQRTFLPSAAGGPLMIHGLDTLRQWVEKCQRTRRGDNPACDPDFGIDDTIWDLLDGGPLDAGIVAQYQDIVERALSVHPAIDRIEQFSVTYDADDDAAFVQLRVIPVAEGADPLDLDVVLPIGG